MKILILIPALLVGCSFPATLLLKEADGKNLSVAIVGQSLREENILTIIRALGRLNDAMLLPGLAIHVYPDSVHFPRTWTGENSVAHTCYLGPSRICVIHNFISDTVLWHEMGHVYQRYLDSDGKEFSIKWKKIAGDVYLANEIRVNNNGILTAYSRGNYQEDIAEWVQECYVQLANQNNWRITGNVHVKTDLRYRQKLALLYEHGFFSKEDYEKLKPLFE